MENHTGVPRLPAATLYTSANNVKGAVPSPNVNLLGIVDTFAACEQLCFSAAASLPCFSFTWHSPAFTKPQYQRHCYGRRDTVWAPVAESMIDSGCRTDIGVASRCAVGPPPGPSPPPPSFHCASDFDCAGANGDCNATTGACVCHAGWSGASCSKVKFAPSSGRVAYADSLWTWGGSPIRDDAEPPLYHLFSSELSNQCGILHYTVNSRVIHLTSPNATGPYVRREIALAPRAGMWDNGAVHGVSVHRLPNKTYAIFYMGATQPGMNDSNRPNCTAGSGDAKANRTTGSHNGRRIGVALSESLEVGAAWRRLDAPLFGPQAGSWDDIDVSNPSPIITQNGSVIMMYKGNGNTHIGQHMGLAFAPSIDGPYTRNNSGKTAAALPGEDPWGWIDPKSGVYHALLHCDNGATKAGCHRYSADGVHWFGDENNAKRGDSYTGHMAWAPDADAAHRGKSTVLARRERPQILLRYEAGEDHGSSYGTPEYLFAASQDCVHHVDAGTGMPCTGAGEGGMTGLTYTSLAAIDLSEG